MKLCELDIRTLKDVVTLKKEKKGDVNFSRMPTSSLISLSALLYGTIDDSLRKRTAMIIKSDSIYGKRKLVHDFTMQDVHINKVIGNSEFNKVFLVEINKEVYAMKVIRKDAVLLQDLIPSLLMEKKILSTMENPFIMALINTLQTDDHVCFILPFIPGGDLFELIKRDVVIEDT
jgi:serine/threonine protein kinase